METCGQLFAVVLVIIIIVGLWEPIKRLFHPQGWDFFVSHRSTDKDVVVPVVEALKRRSFRVWMDLSEIPEQAKDRFRHPISVGIQKSSVALLFTSRDYCASDYCRQEALFFKTRFTKKPGRLVEIRLDENDARDILGMSSESACLRYRRPDAISNGEIECEELVERILQVTSAVNTT